MERLVDGMLKNIVEYFKNRKKKELEEQKRLNYIQKRVMETEIKQRKNRTEENNTRGKQYFYDSNVYGKVFK